MFFKMLAVKPTWLLLANLLNFKVSYFEGIVRIRKEIIVYLTEGCFPASATLRLENGNLVRMSELQVGDRVQTGASLHCIFYLNLYSYFNFLVDTCQFVGPLVPLF